MSFEDAINITLKFEGGLSDIVQDKGGLTKYGISQHSYPGVNIRELTLEKAKEIYKRDFWTPCHCDELLWPINLCLFDWAVNSGPEVAVRFLQRILKVKIDGKLGPKTLASVTLFHDPIEVSKKILEERFNNYLDLVKNNPSNSIFLKGWLKRVNELYFIIGQAYEQINNSKDTKL